MKQPPEIPDALTEFARATTGSYPERYARILDEAFSRHQLMLPASTLRALANGGSFTTAQAAVDQFRDRLHKALAAKIEFGPEIPPAIAAKLSTAVGDIWAECKRMAIADLQAHRQQADEAVRHAQAREQAMHDERAAQMAAHAEALRQRDARVADLEAEKRALLAGVDDLRAQLQQMATRADTASQEARDLRDRVRELGAEVERQRAEMDQVRVAGQRALDEAQAAAEEGRKALLLQLDHVRTQAKEEARLLRAEMVALAKKHDEQAAKASSRSAELAAVNERLAAAMASLASRDSQARSLEQTIAAKDETLTRLTAGFERSAQSLAELQRLLAQFQAVHSKVLAWAHNPKGARADLLALLGPD